MVEVFVACRSA